MATTAADMSDGHTRVWIARLARVLGGAVGAVLIGTMLVSYSSGDAISPTAIPDASASLLGTMGLALLVGLPAAFGLVLALGWREDRPGWPVTGFMLGSAVLAGVFVSTGYSTDAGLPLPDFPVITWWAPVVMPALGALAAYVVLLRRAQR